MNHLKRLRGVLVRNLVPDAGSAAAPDDVGAVGTAVHGESDGGCFFSLHPIDSCTGMLIETSLYVSTMCKERCNPSWTDVEHEDMLVGWQASWDSSRVGIRVWTISCRPRGQEIKGVEESDQAVLKGPAPRVAPWERGQRNWENVTDGGHDYRGACVGMGAEVPVWARRDGPFGTGSGPGQVGAGVVVTHGGGLLGGGWLDSYCSSASHSAHCRPFDVVLSLEVCIVWNDWTALEAPLSQLRTPLPRKALLLSLADSSGLVRTHVDESNESMSKQVHSVAPSVDSDSDVQHRDGLSDRGAINPSDAVAAADGNANIVDSALKEKDRQRQREERERRRDAEREKERHQRAMLLGNRAERTHYGRSGWAAMSSLKASSVEDTLSNSYVKSTLVDENCMDSEGCSRFVAGGEVAMVIPLRCRLRAKALEARRQSLQAQHRRAAEMKLKLEASLAQQAQREREQHAQNEMVLRLKQLRRRVQEEEAALCELKASLQAQERRLAKAREKDTAKAALSLRTRAIAVLDTQVQRANTACQDAGRRMGIDFAIPAAAENDGDGAPHSSIDVAASRHAMTMSAERKILRELRRQLKTRQHYLTASLHSTYPVVSAGDGVSRTICGLNLPGVTSFTGMDDEMVSTALGHACHMVHLIGKYSCVCLRFQPIAMSSRSAMRDLTVQPTKTNLKDGNDFPLYAKGQDRARLLVATQMLAKDVEQLVFAHGLIPADESYPTQSGVLTNLHNIVIACRHRFLAAQGGLEALSALDAQVYHISQCNLHTSCPTLLLSCPVNPGESAGMDAHAR